MNGDMEDSSRNSSAHLSSTPDHESLRVEVRVREAHSPEQACRQPDVAPPAKADEWIHRLLVLGAVLLIAGVYVGAHIRSGWVPADEGALSQSALRTLNGQLPHRDFGEIYTGGLSLIHAVAFRVFGTNLVSLRICVFLFFLAWIPAVYYIALRFTSALGAGLVTLLAVSWSFPNYPAAMPSWYNLFFATFGAAALLRYLEVRTQRWLFLAGFCGGVSLLIKVVGAYYIAGVLLSLAFLEQEAHEPVAARNRAILYRIFSTSALLLFLATLIYEFHGRLGGGELHEFVLPAVVLVGSVLWAERNIALPSAERFRTLFRLVMPFLAGVLTPVAMFLVPYVRTGAVHTFFSGVSSSAIARSVGLGVIRPLGVEQSIYALALTALVAGAMYVREFQGKLVAGVIGLGLLLMLLKSSRPIVSGVWSSVATLTPVVVLAGAAFLLTSTKSSGLLKFQRQPVMVLISIAALCSLVQYPFAAPIYLAYSIPLTLLAAVAIVASAKKQSGTYVLASLAGFYLIFGVVTLVPNYIYELTHNVGAMSELRLERAGGLRIEFAPNYEELIHFLQQHSPNGLMYAGNDCPELYFLSGLKDVTSDDAAASPDEVSKALQSNDVKVVVINEGPFFPGGQTSPEVRAEIMRKFPQQRQLGIFHVFWRP